MAKLNANTIVAHPKTGTPTVLLEGEDVPKWATSLIGDHLLAEGPSEPTDEAPAGNANRQEWADYARTQGASEDELKDPSEGGLGRDDLRAKYGA
jgi:hypothetical protein